MKYDYYVSIYNDLHYGLSSKCAMKMIFFSDKPYEPETEKILSLSTKPTSLKKVR